MKNPSGIRAADILPQNIIDDLAALAAEGDRSLWAIARMAQVMAEELPVRRAILDAAIAQACGWRASRARDVRSVATYYPQWMTDDRPSLSFSHYRAAMSAGELDKSREWLDWCLESADDYGGLPAPVDVLAAKMQAAGDSQAAPVWEKYIRSAFRLLVKVHHHPDVSLAVAAKAYILMEAFEKEFDFLDKE